MNLLLALTLPLLLLLPTAEPAYDEAADAKAEIQRALARATPSRQAVLVVFGANWCPDCLVLDRALKQPPSAALIAAEFAVVKVNIGHYDRNLDLAKQYGVDLQKGIPSVAILSPANQAVYVTRHSELADARHLGDDGIYRFFKQTAAPAKAQPQP